jgi:molybdopterin synthase sulfur carrier subunit
VVLKIKTLVITLKVTVVFLGRASDLVGVNIVELELPEGSKLRDLVKTIGEKINPIIADRYFKGHYISIIHINGVATNDLERELRDGDRITFITPEMGG